MSVTIIRRVGANVEENRCRDALVAALADRYRFARFSAPIDDGGSVVCETSLLPDSPTLTLMREFAFAFVEAWRMKR